MSAMISSQEQVQGSLNSTETSIDSASCFGVLRVCLCKVFKESIAAVLGHMPMLVRYVARLSCWKPS